MFPKYDKKQFANVVTGDETWVHYFEPVRKVSNKIWATKHSKRPITAKRSLSTKKVLYAIFFSGEGVAIKVPVKKGKSITGKYYKDVVLKKLKKYYQKRRPATGFKHVRLLHDNAPAHTSAIVTAFLKKEKVTVLPPPPPSPPYSPAPCDFLFQKLKAFLAGRKYQSRQALGSAIHQYLITVPKSAYRDAFKKWIHRLKLCISSHGEYFEGMKCIPISDSGYRHCGHSAARTLFCTSKDGARLNNNPRPRTGQTNSSSRGANSHHAFKG